MIKGITDKSVDGLTDMRVTTEINWQQILNFGNETWTWAQI